MTNSNPFPHHVRLCHQAGLYRAMTDPLWLARDIMGYDRMDDEFHGPMMEEMWNRDLRRPLIRAAIKEQVESGLLPKLFIETAMEAGRLYEKNNGECWARDHFKTTTKIVQCAKNILIWPEITIAHWHAVEGKAIEASKELGDHFFTNTDFRSLRPEVMPDRNDKQFNKASGFTVNRRRKIGGVYQKKERHATCFPKGAGAEVTGGHAAMGWPDDIIGQSTIDDSALPKIKNWWGSTVTHVIRTDGGWIDATYTPWDEDEIYVDWERDKTGWDCRVRACMEDEDGKPDYHGTPVLYDLKWIKKKQRDSLCNFPYQMMCDRVPDSERRWPVDWTGHCEIDWAMEGAGRTFVLSDPAPMGLSLRGYKDRVRGDTGKDWWAISVVRLRVRGDFQDIILLDGSASQGWSDSQGYDEACRLMKKWGTRYFFDEDYQNQLFGAFYKAARRNGIQPYLERRKDGTGFQLPKYLESYIKNAKKQRFQKLCDRATAGEVFVVSKGDPDKVCPERFWRGNNETTGALTQARKWIPRRGGESNLKWDDHFDSWARATDSKLQQFAAQPETAKQAAEAFKSDPYGHFRRSQERSGPTISRYI